MPIRIKSGLKVVKTKKFRITAFVVGLIVAVSSVISIFSASSLIDVIVKDGEKTVTLVTGLTNPKRIVEKAGFNLDVNDELILDDFSEDDGGTIQINRGKLVRIEDDGKVAYVISYDDSVNDLIEFSGFTVEQDEVIANDVDLTSPSEVYDGMQVFIKKAFTITIVHDSTQDKVFLNECTVADALNEAGITLGEDDIVTPSLETNLIKDTKVTVNRVKFVTRIENEEIPYETEIKYDDNMTVEETKIEVQGDPGEKKLTYIDRIVDGALVNSTLQDEKIYREPVNKVLVIGTKRVDKLSSYYRNGAPISELDPPKDLKLDENGVPTEYKECIPARATAYTDDPITATGVVPIPGHIAVDPTEIPYGSIVYIVSQDGNYVYGYAIATDTGGFVEMGNADIDLFMNNEPMCRDWGNRMVNIYVLEYPD